MLRVNSIIIIYGIIELFAKGIFFFHLFLINFFTHKKFEILSACQTVLDPDQAWQSARLDLFDLFLYVHSTIFQLCGTVLPGLNQY